VKAPGKWVPQPRLRPHARMRRPEGCGGKARSLSCCESWRHSASAALASTGMPAAASGKEGKWFRGLDSNQDSQIQSLVACQLADPGMGNANFRRSAVQPRSSRGRLPRADVHNTQSCKSLLPTDHESPPASPSSHASLRSHTPILSRPPALPSVLRRSPVPDCRPHCGRSRSGPFMRGVSFAAIGKSQPTNGREGTRRPNR
jgi:hypothetical protein